MLYLEGVCPSCEGGSLGVWRCSDGTTLVLMCDECYAVWLEPTDLTIEAARFPGVHTFEIPGLPLKLGGGAAGWATRDQVERAGWQGYIKGEAPGPGENLKRR
jgi:hypothetical protein